MQKSIFRLFAFIVVRAMYRSSADNFKIPKLPRIEEEKKLAYTF